MTTPFLNENALTLLSKTTGVDLNSGSAQALFTCPVNKECVVAKIIVLDASTSLTTVQFSCGWTSAAYNDVITNSAYIELTDATFYTETYAKTGAKVGTSAQIFYLLCNTLQGAAATATIEVWGKIQDP